MWENPIGEGATFWNMEANECLRKLDSGADGLENDQATKRFYPAEKVSPLKRELKLFFSRFADPMMLLLLVAVVLSTALGENADAAIILFILVSSASLAYVQHSRAGHLLEKLQALVVLNSTVIRSGKEDKIPSIQVVPGDVLEFKAGDIVPADCWSRTNCIQMNPDLRVSHFRFEKRRAFCHWKRFCLLEVIAFGKAATLSAGPELRSPSIPGRRPFLEGLSKIPVSL
jgi:hypothetical protein